MQCGRSPVLRLLHTMLPPALTHLFNAAKVCHHVVPPNIQADALGARHLNPLTGRVHTPDDLQAHNSNNTTVLRL